MDEPLARDTLVFGYPMLYKVVGAADALLFLPCAVLSAAAGVWLPNVPLFLAFAGLGVYLFLAFQGSVTVDAQGVTLTRLGRSTRIAYAEITRLQDLASSHALVIHAQGRKLRVEKQLQSYPFFYALLCDRLPPQPEQRLPTLPLQVHTRLWVYLLCGVFLALGLLILCLTLVDWPDTPTDQIAGLLLSALSLGVGIVGLWPNPRMYVFTSDRVEVHRLVGAKVFELDDLQQIQLCECSQGFETAYALRLVFGRGRLEIRATTVDYPLEVLYKALEERYGPSLWRIAKTGRLMAYMNIPFYRELPPETLAAIPDDELEAAILGYIFLKLRSGRMDDLEVVSALSAGMQALYSTWRLEAEVNTGGLDRFFSSSSHRFAGMALRSLELLGADDYRRILVQAMRIHDAESQPLEREEADAEDTPAACLERGVRPSLEECDRAFHGLGSLLGELRIRYIRAHPEQFVGN